jgi:putative transposase
VNRSGYYAWQANPESKRQKQNTKFLGLIKRSWLESGSIYGYGKVADGLRDIGTKCSQHRVYKLMKQAKLASQRGYNRRPYMRSGTVAQAAPNRLDQNFTVPQPNQAWVTDITYIRTHEGWLYLAVVIDLFLRQVVGWSMDLRIDTELVINALLMAVWRRKPKQQVIVHSDQGCQFTSKEWRDFLTTNSLVCSISRRGKCHDNAVAESFFQLLKRERIRRRTYETRNQAREEIFYYIEVFYNRRCRHSFTKGMSPVDFENQLFTKPTSV